MYCTSLFYCERDDEQKNFSHFCYYITGHLSCQKMPFFSHYRGILKHIKGVLQKSGLMEMRSSEIKKRLNLPRHIFIFIINKKQESVQINDEEPADRKRRRFVGQFVPLLQEDSSAPAPENQNMTTITTFTQKKRKEKESIRMFHRRI